MGLTKPLTRACQKPCPYVRVRFLAGTGMGCLKKPGGCLWQSLDWTGLQSSGFSSNICIWSESMEWSGLEWTELHSNGGFSLNILFWVRVHIDFTGVQWSPYGLWGGGGPRTARYCVGTSMGSPWNTRGLSMQFPTWGTTQQPVPYPSWTHTPFKGMGFSGFE